MAEDNKVPVLHVLPSAQEFYLSQHLYDELVIARSDVFKALDIVYFRGTYDCFCLGCGKSSTFRAVDMDRPSHHRPPPGTAPRLGAISLQRPIEPNINGIYEAEFKCTRVETHTHTYYIKVESITYTGEEETITKLAIVQKVGQSPAMADLSLPETKKYEKTLGKEQLREFNKAIGLASHGVGVGSYVYLRRIFEGLVEEAHIVAQGGAGWDEEAYANAYFKDKIAILKDYLPTFLVEHPAMYSLLSKGIHELSEKECLGNFEPLKAGIEMILDQKLEAAEKLAKEQATRAALQKAFGG